MSAQKQETSNNRWAASSIRIELHAAGVSLTEQFLLAISSLSSQICRFGRERRKLNMRDECCSELL